MSANNKFRLLVLTDAHYDPSASGIGPDARGKYTSLGCELLVRAIDDANRRGGFDAIAVMGDFLDDGEADWSDQALDQVAAEITQAADGKPILVVPGNHDGPAKRLYKKFGTRPGLVELAGYRFYLSADTCDGDYCTRSDADRKAFTDIASKPGGPLIALQHNPIYPEIVSKSPFMLINYKQVIEDYSAAGVMLSISGHYHRGQPISELAGVKYATVRALSASPFNYSLVTLEGEDVSIAPRQLAMPDGLDIFDCHTHTEMAYCGTDVTAQANIDRARAFGLSGICVVEHAPQLYVEREVFWHGEYISRPGLWQEGPSRADKFRRDICCLRSDYVRIGLEVDLDRSGKLTIRDEDRDIPDVLLGAVHFMAVDIKSLSDEAFADELMRYTIGLLGAGIDILAHPLRLFSSYGRPIPAHIPSLLAKELAQASVATELNFHHSFPVERFISECISMGVKLATGSDAHQLDKAANLTAGIAMAQSLAGREDISDLLWRPGPAGFTGDVTA